MYISNTKKRRKTTIAQQSRYLLCMLLAILLFFLGGILILNRTQQQVYEQMEELSTLYTDELDNRFLRISRDLFTTIMDSSNPDSSFWKYMDLMETDQYTEYVITQLRNNYVSAAWDFGTDYNIFLYTKEDENLYQLSIPSTGLYTINPYLKESIKRRIKSLDQQTYTIKKKWTVLRQGDDVYMFKMAQSKGVGLGCYVNLKTILEPFSSLSLGKSGYVSLVRQNGENIGTLTEEGIMTDTSKIDTSDYTFRQELSQAPFEIRIKISWTGVLNLMTGSIFALLGVAFLMVIAGSMLLFHLQKRILQPVSLFTENLQKYDNGDYTFEMSEGNLVELEQIDDKFRNMIHQIRRLKITLYEQELEKQKIEMDYLKSQIRPHFYMNCLNFIYSMIDFGQYDNAKSMSRITSDYLGYIFRNTSEMVPVTAEMNHCENYLKILLLRYPEKFTYYFEVHEEVEDAVIFPFLIQVFVENAAKHALTLEKIPLISVTVYPEDRGEEKYVNIYISDTGNGFPEETLQRLKAGEDISEHGKHIGIENCLKRFRYYYGDAGEIHFDNSPLGGAIVDIHIPYQMGRKKMKLLLVDDEEYVIESIKRNLDLEETGVSEVYTAFSVQQAQNIMQMVDIDIVISDIVMPGGTGFDFVEWVREQELKVQVIFLTSYAEFDYARRAIQLNSVDYLLKPIDFGKLKEAVLHAVESVSKEKKIQDLRKESIKWNQNKKILQQDIWKNVLKNGFSEEKFCETAAQRQLPYGPGHYFRLISLMPELKSSKREMWDTATMEFVIENVLSELYEETDIAVDTVIYQEPGIYWIVTQSKEKAFPEDGEQDREILHRFVAWMNEKIYPELWCGVGYWEVVAEIQEQSRNLQKMREGSLSVWNEVLFLTEFQAPKTSYENKELDVWKALLSEEKPDELLEQLQKYLDRTEREGMITREFLVALRTDLTQVVYAWLSDREIKAYALFADADMEKLHRNSLYGRDEMMEYAKVLVQKAVQYRQYINKSDSVTSQVCAYIDAHYREEIHREELGELVFLNTDYLSRIFKKEKGISISNYIIQKRVEEAKKLLTQSTLPINTVSLYVGYSNFSYFTKMFKENTGYAPLEYRRSFSEKK